MRVQYVFLHIGGTIGTSIHAAEEVLDQFREEFISDMDAMAVVYDLLDKGTINEGDK